MARAMGIDPATKQYVPFDITNKKFATNYLDLLHHPLEKQGIDFWWLDWQQEPNTKMPGVSPRGGSTTSTSPTSSAKASARCSSIAGAAWAIIATRSASPATPSPYGSRWRFSRGSRPPQPTSATPTGATTSADTCPARSTRSSTRAGCSSARSVPILRTHTTKNPDAERRIWAYPEPYSDIMRGTYQLRYALLPYIYTEARRTYDTGVAFLHPLYYDWPEAERLTPGRTNTFSATDMIVSPVVAPGDKIRPRRAKSVWLPAGDWVEWATGTPFHGRLTSTAIFPSRRFRSTCARARLSPKPRPCSNRIRSRSIP